MSRTSSRTYNPKTGKWTQNTESPTNNSKPKSSGSNLSSSSTDSKSTKGKVEKKSNKIEYNILTGQLNFIATKLTIKLKAGDTVRLKGIGNYLSGKYYVQDVTRSINSNGYSHSATLIKTDFGKSLKKTTKKSSGTTSATSTESSNTSNKNGKRYYTVKKGDSLYSIAKKYYKDGSKYKKILNADGSKITNPNIIRVGQKLLIP